MRTLTSLLLLTALAPLTSATVNFAQIIEDNLRQQQQEGRSAYRIITTAEREKRPQALSVFTHTGKEARAAILEAFAPGTQAAQIIREFPLKFVLFDVRTDERNGVHIQVEGKTDEIIGTCALILTVDKQWPAGIAPFIQYRFAHLTFNAQGELLEVRIVDEVDAP